MLKPTLHNHGVQRSVIARELRGRPTKGLAIAWPATELKLRAERRKRLERMLKGKS